jgi:hypothetical protein
MAPNIFAFPLLVRWLPAFLLRLLSACPVCMCHCVCVVMIHYVHCLTPYMTVPFY